MAYLDKNTGLVLPGNSGGGNSGDGGGGGGSADFYQCAAVFGPKRVSGFIVSGAGTAAVNGNYLPTDLKTENDTPIYKHETEEYYYFEMWDERGICTSPTQYPFDGLYYAYNGDGGEWVTRNGGAEPAPTVTAGNIVVNADVPKTWNGYKATYDSVTGYWHFDNTVTEGLTYSFMKPEIKGVYDSECTLKAIDLMLPLPNIPQDNLIAYFPLRNNFNDTKERYTPSVTSAIFSERLGRPCLKASGGAYAEWTGPAEDTTGPLSIFCAVSGITYSGWGGIMAIGPGIYNMFGLDNYDTGINGRIGYDWGQFGTLSTDSWDTIAMTRDASGNYVMYQNGESIATTKQEEIRNVNMQYFTAGFCRGAHKGNIYISDCCIYDRALTAEEIKAMHTAVLGG